MQFSSIITALILGAATTAVSGAAVPPAVEALVELDARASAVCGSNSYSSAAVQAAATRACQNWRGRISPSGYPHVYNNREGLRFAVAGQYVEFPILANGRVFTGGKSCAFLLLSFFFPSGDVRLPACLETWCQVWLVSAL